MPEKWILTNGWGNTLCINVWTIGEFCVAMLLGFGGKPWFCRPEPMLPVVVVAAAAACRICDSFCCIDVVICLLVACSLFASWAKLNFFVGTMEVLAFGVSGLVVAVVAFDAGVCTIHCCCINSDNVWESVATISSRAKRLLFALSRSILCSCESDSVVVMHLHKCGKEQLCLSNITITKFYNTY